MTNKEAGAILYIIKDPRGIDTDKCSIDISYGVVQSEATLYINWDWVSIGRYFNKGPTMYR